MKLLSYTDSASRVAAVLGDGAGLPDATADVHDVLLDGEPWLADMRGLIEASAGEVHRLTLAPIPHGTISDLRITAPLPNPSKIIAAPVNYFDHKAEMNEDTHIDGLGVFLKAPSSLIGDHEVIRLPYDDRRFDQEGEFAFVIGRTARHVSAETALNHIFGFTCLLDITMRGGEDRSTRKSFDTFTPMGPWLVTPDEVGDLGALRLTCTVNGELRQDGAVSDLIWGVPELLAYASSVMTLMPGDVITTGTPAGVGRIKRGDDVAVSITGVGTLTVTVDDRGAVHCPTKGARHGPVPPDQVTPIPAPPTSA